MTIFLDKQRPPSKRMGRLQRKGSKSNPRTGVQWANWLDIPGSGGGGGGGGGSFSLTSVAPMTVVAGAPTNLIVTGVGFSATDVVRAVVSTGPGTQASVALPTTFVSATTLHATLSQPTPASVDIWVRSVDADTDLITITVVAGQADPTQSWTKAQIIEWLQSKGVAIGDNANSHFSKPELLEIVEAYLNGDPVDDLIGN